jgi:hypothetical protein
MTRNVLIVSHADADGHVIAEQVRRNLATVGSFSLSTVVDPARTKDHKTWLHLDAIKEIEQNDIVLFVDLMFAPASFDSEADALVRFATAHPNKWFVVLDHHPVPARRLGGVRNLRALYRPDVIDCTIGTSSRMMMIAALCEKQETRAEKRRDYQVLARGIHRAAAVGGTLPGEKLLALIRFGYWAQLAQLGSEDVSEHPMPRGRRRPGFPPSPALLQLDRIAADLLTGARPHTSGSNMSYDFESAADRDPPHIDRPAAQGNDLEAIVTLLELAAIYLTASPGATFTLDELVQQAEEIGGIVINKKDARIVLDKARFLRKHPEKRFSLR